MDLRGLLESNREEIIRIATQYGARNIRVFGSVVRGDTHEDSDIDFLVEFEPGTSLLTHASLVVALEDLLGHKVDVAPEKALKDRIRKRVLSEALPL